MGLTQDIGDAAAPYGGNSPLLVFFLENTQGGKELIVEAGRGTACIFTSSPLFFFILYQKITAGQAGKAAHQPELLFARALV